VRLIDFRTGTRWPVVDHGNRSKKYQFVVTSFCSPLHPMAFVEIFVMHRASCSTSETHNLKDEGSKSIELVKMISVV